jgi:hypothetical protein
VLEPVVGKINERTKAPVSLSSRLGLRQPRSEWFRVYRVRIHHIPPARIPEINVITGLFPSLGVVRSYLLESKDRHIMHEGFRDHGSFRVSHHSQCLVSIGGLICRPQFQECHDSTTR